MNHIYSISLSVVLTAFAQPGCSQQKKLEWDLSSSRKTIEIGWASDGKVDLTSVAGPCSIVIKLDGGCEVKANVQNVVVAADENEIEYIMLEFGHVSSKEARTLHNATFSDVIPGKHVFKTFVESKSPDGIPVKTVKSDKLLDLWWEAKPDDDDEWLCTFAINFVKK